MITGATTLRGIAAARPRPQAIVQSSMRLLAAVALGAAGYHAFAHVLYVLAAIALVASIEAQVAAAIVEGVRRLWRSKKKAGN